MVVWGSRIPFNKNHLTWVFCVRVFAVFHLRLSKKKTPPTSEKPKSTGPGRPSHVPAQRRDHHGGKHLVTGRPESCSRCSGLGLDQLDHQMGPIFRGNQTIQILWQLGGISLNALFGLVSCNDPC